MPDVWHCCLEPIFIWRKHTRLKTKRPTYYSSNPVISIVAALSTFGIHREHRSLQLGKDRIFQDQSTLAQSSPLVERAYMIP